MADILEKTNQILEKSENPFVISNLRSMSVRKIVDITRKVWYNFFDNESITFQWKEVENSDKTFLLSQDGLEILITDIVENMHKYHNGNYSLKFLEEGNAFALIFENNVKNYDHVKPELEKLVEDFTNNDNSEINKRKTHGMSMIKSFLTQMNIVHNLLITDGIFCLKLIFNK